MKKEEKEYRKTKGIAFLGAALIGFDMFLTIIGNVFFNSNLSFSYPLYFLSIVAVIIMLLIEKVIGE